MTSIPLLQDDLEMGLEKGVESDFAYRNNVHTANIYIRHGFLRKVYSLLLMQLTTTTIIAGVMMFVPKVRFFIVNNDWLVSLAFLLSIVILIALHIKRKESPANIILLGLFTVVQAYTVGVIVTFSDKFVVLEAFLITTVVVAGLTAFTFQTKRDFSKLGLFLFVCLTTLLIASFVQLFVASTVFEMVISVAGAFLFCLFIIYDTQDLMKRMSPEEYILATINLYLDIINLFIYILRILEAVRK